MMHHNFELASIFEEYIVHIPSQKHIFYETLLKHSWELEFVWFTGFPCSETSQCSVYISLGLDGGE